jgi:5-(carboxyamino)imidazole ribonucleotide synthase
MELTTPGPTLGVVGGGQLGRMLGEAAGPLGIEVVVSDPTPACPASPVVRDQVLGDFDEYETVRTLAERADVLTYEIELADPDVLGRVAEETDTPVHPDPETLRAIQDKLVQNRLYEDAGIPIPAFRAVEDEADLRAAGEQFGWPVMLKAREGGYDGRGNRPVEGPETAADALAEIGENALAEAMVPFERELAVIGCRGADGIDTFPVTETVHREEILRESVSPARTDSATRERATEVARRVLGELDGRGVYGIELFEVDGEILVNEVAPRPHNSGHWTIEGCHVSQFEQHVRAVTGLPLGTTARRGPTVSANLLGEGESREARLAGLEEALATPRLAMHWYGKREVRPLRKMGHLTLAGEPDGDVESLLGTVREARAELTFR